MWEFKKLDWHTSKDEPQNIKNFYKIMSPGLVLLCVAEKENLWDKAG